MTETLQSLGARRAQLRAELASVNDSLREEIPKAREALTMAQIAELVGVSRQTLYDLIGKVER